MAGPASSVSGKSWDSWPADDADECSLTSSSGSSSTVSSGTATPIGNPSSPSQTPLLVRRHHPSSSDDVMKLPRRDMKIFGEFPGRDDFLLVLCDTCHRYIKAEAFEAHCRQRHDYVGRQGGGRAAAAAVASTRGKAAQLRSCTVELTKEDLFPLSSSSSSATTAETSAATTMVSSPAASLTKEEPMDESNPVMMVNPVSESRTTLAPPTPMEEADSTTANNVISIPDTDPLPAMSNELMAMVSGEPVILPKSEAASGPNAPSGAGVDSTSARVGGGGGKRGSAAAAFQISPHSVIKLQINPPPPLPPPALPTHPNPPSPAANKKASPGKKGGSLLSVVGGVGGGGGGRQDRRALQREYNPDKHCGVWDNESKRHCTRALTCKSHSVLLKRNIQGRSKSFDDLVQEHKAQKEAQQAAAAALAGAAAAAAASGPAPLRTTSRPPPGVLANAESVLSSITEPNPIDPRFSIPTSTNGIRIKSGSSAPYVPPVTSGAKMTAVSTTLNGSKKSLLCLSSPPSKESDENVIYTTDHPKPLAVCTFGGRRVGGLLVTDRSQFLTRKVVRVAISAGGFHRIRPASRLNELKFGNNVIRRPGAGVGGGGGGPTIPANARIVTAPGLAATANNYLVNYNLTPTAVVQAAGQALPQQPTAAATASAAAAAAARVMTSVTVAGAPGGTPTSVAGAPSLAIAPQIGRVAVNLAPLPPNAVVATSGLPPGINIATTSDATFKTELQDFKGGIKFELGRNMKPILPTSSDVAK